MEIEKSVNGETTVFAVSGKIDTNSAAILEDTLLEHINNSKTQFEIDLSNVKFVSSAGLRAFLSAQKKANASKVSMVLTGVGKQMQEILDITGFSGILTIQ